MKATHPHKTRVVLGLALLLATFPLAAVPLAEAQCSTIAILTLGGPGYPSEGVYYEEDCTPGDNDQATATFELGSANGALVPQQCQPVEGVYVLGTQVPGTGTTHCTVAIGGPITVSQPINVDDVGVATCLNRFGFTCTYTSTAFALLLCGVDTGAINLGNGYSVRAACALS